MIVYQKIVSFFKLLYIRQWVYAKKKSRRSLFTKERIKLNNDVSLGSNCSVGSETLMNGIISIGDNVSIGQGCVLSGNITIGNNVRIGSGARLYSDMNVGKPAEIKIGNYVEIGRNSTIEGRGGIIIDNEVLISWNVSIVAAQHDYSFEHLCSSKKIIAKPVIIESNIWIGCNSTILMDTILPEGCIIGASSVVTKKTKLLPYHVAVGNPAKIIKKRTDLE